MEATEEHFRVVGRKFLNAEDNLAPLVGQAIVKDCPCGRFYIACTFCGDHPDSHTHAWVAFFDGACPGNGSVSAVAGLAVAQGSGEHRRFSIPLYGNYTRWTNQKAELLAATHAVQVTLENIEQQVKTGKQKPKLAIFAGDSEYVVKGITEWYNIWARNGWRKPSSNQAPANLDLFHQLDNTIRGIEGYGVDVGFWWIKREFNIVADALTRQAAEQARLLRQSSQQQ